MYIQKTFRIRPEAYETYKFLDFIYVRDNKTREGFFDNVINYSFDYIKNNKVFVALNKYDSRRDVKGFTLKKSTLEKIFEFHSNNSFLMLAEIVELFIYIYAVNNLSEHEIKMLNLSFVKPGITNFDISSL